MVELYLCKKLSMSEFTVTVTNIKPYLVDFLLGQYPDYVEFGKLTASLNIYPGKLIHELLAPQPQNYEVANKNTEGMEIILPYYNDLNVRSRNYLSINSQRIFCKKIRAHFTARLVEYIQDAMRSGIDFIDAVDRFMEIKSINPENITRNALIKDFYRFRKKENNDNFLNFSKKKHYLNTV